VGRDGGGKIEEGEKGERLVELIKGKWKGRSQPEKED
jgi:hypothetical protein